MKAPDRARNRWSFVRQLHSQIAPGDRAGRSGAAVNDRCRGALPVPARLCAPVAVLSSQCWL